MTKKFKVGIEFSLIGLHYFPIDAETENEAEQLVERLKDDIAMQAIMDGAGELETEIVDVIPRRE